MFCKQCGTQLPGGSRFCAACGEDLGGSAGSVGVAAVLGNSEAAAKEAERAETKSTMKVAIIAVVIIGLIILSLPQFHVCDFCEETFWGPGYANAEYDVQICNDCAENYHWLGL